MKLRPVDSPFEDPGVADVFSAMAPDVRDSALALRTLVFDVANTLEEVGGLTETIKWGQPAYLGKRPRVGTTLRIDAVSNAPGHVGMFIHCATSVLNGIRTRYGNRFRYEGNRCVIISPEDIGEREAISHCIAMALTYHVRRRNSSSGLAERKRGANSAP